MKITSKNWEKVLDKKYADGLFCGAKLLKDNYIGNKDQTEWIKTFINKILNENK